MRVGSDAARGVCSAQDAGGKELIPTALMQVLLPFQGLPRQFASTTCVYHEKFSPFANTTRTEFVLAEFTAETAAPGPAAHRGLPGPRYRQRPVRRHGPPGPRQQRGLSDLFRDRPRRADLRSQSTACRSKAAPPCWRASRSISSRSCAGPARSRSAPRIAEIGRSSYVFSQAIFSEAPAPRAHARPWC